MKKWLKLIQQAWKQFLSSQKPSTPSTPTTPPVVTPPADVPATGSLTPKPATLCYPEKGVECPVPWGMDVRFLAWAGDDWIFIGSDAAVKATGRQGKAITGNDFTRNGIRYVYAGYKVPRSAGPLIAERTGQYAETYRLYYWPTRDGAQ
jgi:hypothetical protein